MRIWATYNCIQSYSSSIPTTLNLDCTLPQPHSFQSLSSSSSTLPIVTPNGSRENGLYPSSNPKMNPFRTFEAPPTSHPNPSASIHERSRIRKKKKNEKKRHPFFSPPATHDYATQFVYTRTMSRNTLKQPKNGTREKKKIKKQIHPKPNTSIIIFLSRLYIYIKNKNTTNLPSFHITTLSSCTITKKITH